MRVAHSPAVRRALAQPGPHKDPELERLEKRMDYTRGSLWQVCGSCAVSLTLFPCA